MNRMSKRKKFSNTVTWKFDLNIVVEAVNGVGSKEILLIQDYLIYNRSTLKYYCKNLARNIMQEWDKKYLEDQGILLDKKVATVIYEVE